MTEDKGRQDGVLHPVGRTAELAGLVSVVVEEKARNWMDGLEEEL